MIRYLLIATHVPPSGAGGGMVRYAVELSRGLATMAELELHVAVAPGAEPFFETFVSSSRIWTVPAKGRVLRSVRETFGRLGGAPLGEFDVVHGTKHLLPTLPRPLRNPVLLLTIHDLFVFERPGDYSAAKRLLVGPPYRRSMAAADALITDSDATRARLAAYDTGLHNKATTVALAVSPHLAGASAQRPAIPEGRLFGLVVGDAAPRKNLPVAMAAWGLACRAVPDALLVHVGPPGWGTDSYGSQYQALVEAGSVVSLGHVPDGQLRWLYENAAVCLCPSLAEGFGLPAAEAAHFGTPMVRSADDALREAAGGAGTEVPTGDVDAWAKAIEGALRAPKRTGRPGIGPTEGECARTWNDVAYESWTVAARAAAAREERA